MVERNIFAGFGGQGVLLMGQLLAAAGMMEGKNTSWIPSYGPEMRGGTANCSVMLSDEEIDSPLVTRPTSLIVMNRPSLEKFEDKVVPGGSIFVNSSMIDIKVKRTDVSAYYVPCTEIASELGNSKVSNMIMLGAYLGKSKCVEVETVLAQPLHPVREGAYPGKDQRISFPDVFGRGDQFRHRAEMGDGTADTSQIGKPVVYYRNDHDLLTSTPDAMRESLTEGIGYFL